MIGGKIFKVFNEHNVAVTGEKGSGKDVLFGNVIARRGIPYVSNMNYGYDHIPFTYADIAVGNTYDNFINGNIHSYHCPYCDGTDLYISDAGIYFPSQYCNELNKKYADIPVYMALSRQINDGRVHYNCQVYSRVWDKIREQCTRYIRCNWCKHILGYVIMSVTYYDKAESCQARARPCRVSVPVFSNSQARMSAQIYRDQFYNTYGTVSNHLLIFRNKSKHDTRRFKGVLANEQEA